MGPKPLPAQPESLQFKCFWTLSAPSVDFRAHPEDSKAHAVDFKAQSMDRRAHSVDFNRF